MRNVAVEMEASSAGAGAGAGAAGADVISMTVATSAITTAEVTHQVLCSSVLLPGNCV